MIVHLNGATSVRTAETLRAMLLDAFEQADSIELDVPALTEADLSVVQLIEAARAHATRENKRVHLTAPAHGALLDLLLRAGILTDPAAEDIDFWCHGELPQ